MDIEPPVNVNVINRGEAAATGPGLVLGTFGAIIVICAMAVVFLVAAVLVIPVAIVVGVGWLLLVIVRMEARWNEHLSERGLKNMGWPER